MQVRFVVDERGLYEWHTNLKAVTNENMIRELAERMRYALEYVNQAILEGDDQNVECLRALTDCTIIVFCEAAGKLEANEIGLPGSFSSVAFKIQTGEGYAVYTEWFYADAETPAVLVYS